MFDVPAKATVIPRPKDQPLTSQRAWVQFHILHAPSLQSALRYFQSLEAVQALYIYGEIQRFWDKEFGDMEVYHGGLTYEDLYTLLRDYLVYCLDTGWTVCPI